jgi:hypothetical protein
MQFYPPLVYVPFFVVHPEEQTQTHLVSIHHYVCSFTSSIPLVTHAVLPSMLIFKLNPYAETGELPFSAADMKLSTLPHFFTSHGLNLLTT